MNIHCNLCGRYDSILRMHRQPVQISPALDHAQLIVCASCHHHLGSLGLVYTADEIAADPPPAAPNDAVGEIMRGAPP